MTGHSRTQVAIVGAGPAGLTLGRLLELEGIESVILELRSREYVERRIRAGVLEQGTVDLMVEIGVGDRMQREGLVHHGIELRFDHRGHRVPFDELTGGGGITIYGQQELIKDLVRARLAGEAPLLFGVQDVELKGLNSTEPEVRFRHDGHAHVLRCDVVAGCDGFHGVSRDTVPTGRMTFHSREYPFAWLGILAQAPPATDELIYAHHDRGFALHSMRSPRLSRLYLQCAPSDRIDDWPDQRIWDELRTRLDCEGWSLTAGPILEKGITPMRGFVSEPMQWGRLFLAGDAVHIVPPTGAKGLNVAVADVSVLADALARSLTRGDGSWLEQYSEVCLERVWRAQLFSWWMTSMLHRFPNGSAFDGRLQRAQLANLCSSDAAATMLAENYVGVATGTRQAA